MEIDVRKVVMSAIIAGMIIVCWLWFDYHWFHSDMTSGEFRRFRWAWYLYAYASIICGVLYLRLVKD
jgi:hypothetical protein